MKPYILLLLCIWSSEILISQTSVHPAMNEFSHFSNVRDFTISNNGREAYFTMQSPLEEVSRIIKIVKQKAEWTNPEVVSFSTGYRDIEPFLSPDNLRLYFASNVPTSDTSNLAKDFDLYYVERPSIDAEWSVPVNLGEPINTEANEFYPSVAKNGNLYFTCDRSDAIGKDDIFMAKFQNGEYSVPENLGAQINTKGYEFNAYISRDESYLIFSGYNREDGLGSGDLYISLKNEKDLWSKAEPLSNSINSRYMDYCPFVDEKNGYLYFTSRRSTISTEASIDNVQDFFILNQQYENGRSRIYRVEWLQ